MAGRYEVSYNGWAQIEALLFHFRLKLPEEGLMEFDWWAIAQT